MKNKKIEGPVILVISGNSGAGKSTLAKQLCERKGLARSVSCTTRAPRPGEVDGVHYHFASEEHFEDLVKEGAFLEHAGVYGKRYGTLVTEVLDRIGNGVSTILTIDTKGYDLVKNHPNGQVRAHLYGAFLWASDETLRRRMDARGGVSEEEKLRRLAEAQDERSKMHLYDLALESVEGEEAMYHLFCEASGL